jgi:hypothetical protein
MAFSNFSPSNYQGKFNYGPRAKWAAKRTCAVHRTTCRLRELVDRLKEKRRISLLTAGVFRLSQPHAH